MSMSSLAAKAEECLRECLRPSPHSSPQCRVRSARLLGEAELRKAQPDSAVLEECMQALEAVLSERYRGGGQLDAAEAILHLDSLSPKPPPGED